MKKILLFGLLFCSVAVMSQPIIPHRGKIMQVYGGDTLKFGFDGMTMNGKTIPYIMQETVNITSANILSGDSLLIIAAETGVKTTPVFISVKYTDGTTYTHTDTDTTFIYTYANTVKTKIAYITDSFIEGTVDNYASISIDEISGSAEQPYWIDLKNFNAGTGTLSIDFYYLKK